ncbi:MAG: chemotaxis protein CheX [bacterium]|nr:chemotaxis protein CheX [bacterium]
MDVSVVNPFLKAAMNMFNEMFGITLTFGKPFIVTPFGNHRWEISGVIGIVGDSEGVLVLRVTKVFAQKLLEKSGLIIEEDSERAQVLYEMISEFVNIISGNALAEMGDRNVGITPPIAIHGLNHTIACPIKTPLIGVHFFS